MAGGCGGNTGYKVGIMMTMKTMKTMKMVVVVMMMMMMMIKMVVVVVMMMMMMRRRRKRGMRPGDTLRMEVPIKYFKAGISTCKSLHFHCRSLSRKFLMRKIEQHVSTKECDDRNCLAHYEKVSREERESAKHKKEE